MTEILHFEILRKHGQTHKHTNRHGHYNTSPSPYGGRGKYGYTDYWPIRHTKLPGVKPISSNDVDVNDSPVVQDYVCPERSRRNDVSVYVDTQLLVKNFQQKMTFCCFGLCGLTDRFNEPELRWCWDCVDRLVWGYRVSCLMASVNANRSLLIDAFTEESRVYARGLGLLGDPVRPYDVIHVYLCKRELQGWLRQCYAYA